MQAVKLSALFGVLIFLSGCASLSGGSAKVETPPDPYSDVKSIETQSKLARLQTENARLANRVLELQRENERLRGANSDVAKADIEDDAAFQDTAVALREPEVYTNPVFDNPDAPEMARSDVPVEPAPRLTQPTFASTDAVFENEAGSVISAATDLFGVHLASYREADEARQGWQMLQRENPTELGLLEPRLQMVDLPEKGLYLRLIGGGLSSEEKARALCASLQDKGLYCAVSSFEGERLSLSETG